MLLRTSGFLLDFFFPQSAFLIVFISSFFLMAVSSTSSAVRSHLLTPELLRRFEEVGMQESNNPLVICKFFDPCGAGTWFATEFDPRTRKFFGYVTLISKEWGYFGLTELERVRGRLGLGIERDLYFHECRFSALRL